MMSTSLRLIPTFTRFAAALLAVSATLLALAGCGAGSVKDPYNAPSYGGGATAATAATASVIVFGDAVSDTTAGAQYTVNDDAGITNWTVQLASSYGVPANGIKSYAIGNATIANIATQVTTAGSIYGRDPLVLVSGGYRDLINIAEAGGTQAAMVASARSLGVAYADVVRSAVSAGAKHVLVANLYNLSQTPYQTIGGRTTATHPLSLMVRAFNDALKSNLGDPAKTYLGDTVRLGNAEQYMGGIMGSPTDNGFTDATTMVCATTANDLGITGITASAKSCTMATLSAAPVTTANYNSYVFADPINFTPAAHRSWGTGMRSFANW